MRKERLHEECWVKDGTLANTISDVERATACTTKRTFAHLSNKKDRVKRIKKEKDLKRKVVVECWMLHWIKGFEKSMVTNIILSGGLFF